MSNSSIQQTCSMKTMWKYILRNINLFENEITFPLNIPIRLCMDKIQWMNMLLCISLWYFNNTISYYINTFYKMCIHIQIVSYTLLCHGYGCCFVWCFTVFPAISLWAHWHQRRIRFKSYLRMHSNKISYAISFL